MNLMAGVFLFLALLVVVLTILPFLDLRHWWVRAGEFPRLQLAVLAVALLFFQAAAPLRSSSFFWLTLVLIACIVYQLAWVLPYTPLFRREVRPASRPVDGTRCISVLSANILMSNRNVADLRQLIAAQDPDVVLLAETDRWWQERLQDLRGLYPNGADCPLDNRYGMHLYSRLPLREVEVRFLVEDDVPSIHAEVKLRSGHWVRLYCLHPTPPSPTENETSRERDAELLVVARTIEKTGGSAIATGDFNDVAWSPTTRLFRKISGLLDPRIGRGMFNTFPARTPFFRFPLDHVFHSNDFTLAALRVLPRIGSDHLPIYYRLQHEPMASADQHPPEPDEEDHERAEELIRAGIASGEDQH